MGAAGGFPNVRTLVTRTGFEGKTSVRVPGTDREKSSPNPQTFVSDLINFEKWWKVLRTCKSPS